jgi:hypothetical protein
MLTSRAGVLLPWKLPASRVDCGLTAPTKLEVNVEILVGIVFGLLALSRTDVRR